MLPTINTAASISHTGHHPDISTQLTADAVPHERRTIQIHRRTRFASSSALSLFFVQVLFFHCSQQSLSLSLSHCPSCIVPLSDSLCLCVVLSHNHLLTLWFPHSLWIYYFILHPFFSLCVTVWVPTPAMLLTLTSVLNSTHTKSRREAGEEGWGSVWTQYFLISFTQKSPWAFCSLE